MYVVKRCDVGVVEYFPNVDGKQQEYSWKLILLLAEEILGFVSNLALSHMFDNHRKEYINNWKWTWIIYTVWVK